MGQLLIISDAFYSNRFSRDFKSKTRAEIQSVFEKAGLVSEYWRVD